MRQGQLREQWPQVLYRGSKVWRRLLLFPVALSFACGLDTPTPPVRGTHGTIDRSGGTREHSLRDFTIEVQVPEGALQNPIDLTIAEAPPYKAPGSIGPVFELGPSPYHFDKRVQLAITLDPAQLPLVMPAQLALATYVDGHWQKLEQVETGDSTRVAAYTEHFSLFGIVAEPSEPAQLYEEEGTVFSAGGMVLTSSEVLRVPYLEVGTSWIAYLVESGAPSAEFALSGLRPNTIVYVSDGSFRNHYEVQTDSVGSLSFTQPLAGLHGVMLRTAKSTLYVDANLPGGGDCAAVGSWDGASRTCQLTQDVSQTIELDSSDTHLDCSDPTTGEPHHVTTLDGGFALSIGMQLGTSTIQGPSVRNCVAVSAQTALIIWPTATTAIVADNDLSNTSDLDANLFIFGASLAEVTGNQLSGPLKVTNAQAPTIVDNDVVGSLNISGIQSTLGAVRGNRINGGTIEITAGASGNLIEGNVLQGAGSSIGIQHWGLGTGKPEHQPRGNTFRANVVSGYQTGVSFFDDGGAVVTRNSISENGRGLRFATNASLATRVFLNDIVANGVQVSSVVAPIELSDTDPASVSYQRGNYWGRACPGPVFFDLDIDSDNPGVVDSYPFGVAVAERNSAETLIPPACDSAVDLDGDGYASIADGGEDCNDTDPTIHPGATELCDGLDHDCDGVADGLRDDDGDGFYAPGPCVTTSVDCDDSDASRHPGAFEWCDQIDNDCDGETDEGACEQASFTPAVPTRPIAATHYRLLQPTPIPAGGLRVAVDVPASAVEAKVYVVPAAGTRLPRTTVAIDGTEAVFTDAVSPGSLGLVTPIAPGTHQIAVDVWKLPRGNVPLPSLEVVDEYFACQVVRTPIAAPLGSAGPQPAPRPAPTDPSASFQVDFNIRNPNAIPRMVLTKDTTYPGSQLAATWTPTDASFLSIRDMSAPREAAITSPTLSGVSGASFAFGGDTRGSFDFQVVDLDTTPPSGKITEPLAGAVLSSQSAHVAGFVSEDAARIFVNGERLQTFRGGSTHFDTYVPLHDGDNTIVVCSEDVCGNPSCSLVVVKRACTPRYGGVEACNGVDDDCDGEVDEDCLPFDGCDASIASCTFDPSDLFEREYANFSAPGSTSSPERADTAELGDTQGTLKVGPDGAATYTVPLDIPPGRAGMQPQLSLEYNSRRGNGLLGIGWSIGGLSEIRRCAHTYADDGKFEAIRLDDTDAFCLDGVRLLEVGQCADGGTEYRTRTNPFSRICGYAGFFKVFDKSGRILTYGMPGNTAPVVGNAVVAWPVTRVEDRRHNYYELEYASLQSDNLNRTVESGGTIDLNHSEALLLATAGPAYYIQRIRYTGAPGLQPLRTIEFVWDGRPDVIRGFYHGQELIVEYRLAAVRIFGPGSTETSAREYFLGYDNDVSLSGRSHLKSVQDCTGDDICKPPLAFDWSRGPSDYPSGSNTRCDHQSDVPIPYPMAPWHVIDVDGDGVPNFVPALDSNGNSTFPLDYNGDGKTDVVQVTSDFQPWLDANNKWGARRVYTISFLRAPNFTVGTTETLATDPEDEITIHTGDFDGNGTGDLAVIRPPHSVPDAWAGVYILRETGDKLVWLYGRVPAQQIGSSMVGDFDGDGADELLLATLDEDKSPHWWTSDFDSSATQPLKFRETEFPDWWGKDKPYRVLDLNGDGLDDVVTDFWDTVRVYIGDGSGFTKTNQDWDLQWSSRSNFERIFRHSVVVDFDGDGKQELLAERPEELRSATEVMHWRYYLIGAAEDPSYPNVRRLLPDGVDYFTAPTLKDREAWHGYAFPQLFVGDFNRDGVLDFGTSLSGFFYCRGSPGENIVGIHRGLDSQNLGDAGITIAYGSTLNSDVYTGLPVGSDCPTVDGQCATPHFTVVRQVSRVADDNGAHRTTDYHYEGSRQHRLGRGWLGFKVFSVREDDAGFASTTTFDVDSYDAELADFPYRQFATSVVRSFTLATEPSLEVRVEAETSLPSLHKVGASYFVGVSESTISARENAVYSTPLGKRTIARDYDDYGNIVREEALEETAPGGAGRTGRSRWALPLLGTEAFGTWRKVKRTFDYDPDAWLVGRLKTETSYSESSLCRAAKSGFGQLLPWASGVDACADNGSVERQTVITYYPDAARADLPWTIATSGSSGLGRTTTVEYDNYGNIADRSTEGVVDADGTEASRDVTISYDETEHLFPVSSTNALGQTTRRVFDRDLGVLVMSKRPSGVVEWSQVDGLGRTVASGASGGAVSLIELEDRIGSDGHRRGITVVVRDSGGGRATVDYDRLAREVHRSTLLDYRRGLLGQPPIEILVEEQRRYDLLGRVTRVSLPRSIGTTSETGISPGGDGGRPPPPEYVTREYDVLGRLLREVGTDGTTTFSYEGLVSHRTDARGHTRDTITNFQGQTLAVIAKATIDGLQRQIVTRYGYDAFGAPAFVADPDGRDTGGDASKANITRVVRDAFGRKRQVVDPDTGKTTFLHNAFGEVIREDDAAGRDIVWQYDALGRPVTRTDADGDTVWTWDTEVPGLLSSTVGPDGHGEQRFYDAYGRLRHRDSDVALRSDDPTLGLPRFDGQVCYAANASARTAASYFIGLTPPSPVWRLHAL